MASGSTAMLRRAAQTTHFSTLGVHVRPARGMTPGDCGDPHQMRFTAAGCPAVQHFRCARVFRHFLLRMQAQVQRYRI